MPACMPLNAHRLPTGRARMQERRREMAKTVSKLGEEGKVALRNVRRDAMKAVERLEKDGAVSGAREGVRRAGGMC